MVALGAGNVTVGVEVSSAVGLVSGVAVLVPVGISDGVGVSLGLAEAVSLGVGVSPPLPSGEGVGGEGGVAVSNGIGVVRSSCPKLGPVAASPARLGSSSAAIRIRLTKKLT
jgi:hypothetical protein